MGDRLLYVERFFPRCPHLIDISACSWRNGIFTAALEGPCHMQGATVPLANWEKRPRQACGTTTALFFDNSSCRDGASEERKLKRITV